MFFGQVFQRLIFGSRRDRTSSYKVEEDDEVASSLFTKSTCSLTLTLEEFLFSKVKGRRLLPRVKVKTLKLNILFVVQEFWDKFF